MIATDSTTLENDGEFSFFEVAADFFSLISLAAIYAVVTFGTESGRTGPLPVSSSFEASGGAGAIVADTLLIVIEGAGHQARVTLFNIGNGTRYERLFQLDERSINNVVDWIDSQLDLQKSFSKVQLRLDDREKRPFALASFTLVLRYLESRGLTVEAGV